MRIATWNVNSVKQRIENLTAWLAERAPDIVCLQETKTVDEAFPRGPIEALGYNVAVHGQKTFNGVAILSKFKFDEVTAAAARRRRRRPCPLHRGTVSTKAGSLRVASIYLPNGNPPDTEKYSYKIRWMDRLFKYAHERLELEEPLILAGDFNVIPAADDVHNPAAWTDRRAVPAADPGEVPRSDQPRTDRRHPRRQRAPGLYTFWDYQAGAWQKNWGIRIDHLLLSPQAADRLTAAGIDKHVRSWERPSDHVPVWVDLAIERPDSKITRESRPQWAGCTSGPSARSGRQVEPTLVLRTAMGARPFEVHLVLQLDVRGTSNFADQ